MNKKEIKLQKGDVIEDGLEQYVYDGDEQWIITTRSYALRSMRAYGVCGHTVDLSDFDVWRNGKKLLEVPVEPVVFTKELLGLTGTFHGYDVNMVIIPMDLDPTRPFKVTFEQEVVK